MCAGRGEGPRYLEYWSVPIRALQSQHRLQKHSSLLKQCEWLGEKQENTFLAEICLAVEGFSWGWMRRGRN